MTVGDSRRHQPLPKGPHRDTCQDSCCDCESWPVSHEWWSAVPAGRRGPAVDRLLLYDCHTVTLTGQSLVISLSYLSCVGLIVSGANYFNPRTVGGPSHLSTDGVGADNRPPPEISKTKQASDKR